MEPESRHSCVRPGSTSRLREPVTGRQERPNSSTRSHDPITDKWKEIRHDYLEETSGCACLGARRDRASIAKLCPARPQHQRSTRGCPSGVQLLQRLRLGLCISGLYGSTWPSRVAAKRVNDLIANRSSERRTGPHIWRVVARKVSVVCRAAQIVARSGGAPPSRKEKERASCVSSQIRSRVETCWPRP